MTNDTGEGESYEAESEEADIGPADEPEEGLEESEEPQIDYKAEHEKLAKMNEDKAKALRVERDRHRETKAQIRALQERLDKLSAPKEEEIPNEDEDPIGAIKAMKAKLAAQEKANGQQTEAQRQAQANQARLAELSEMEADYAADNPEYGKASEFFGNHLRGELEEQGYSGADLDKAFGETLMKLVDTALKAGKHPGDVVMNLARKNGFGKAVVDKASQKIDKMRTAQAESSLSSARSNSGPKELTFEYVATLKGEAKAKAFERLRAQELRKQA